MDIRQQGAVGELLLERLHQLGNVVPALLIERDPAGAEEGVVSPRVFRVGLGGAEESCSSVVELAELQQGLGRPKLKRGRELGFRELGRRVVEGSERDLRVSLLQLGRSQ